MNFISLKHKNFIEKPSAISLAYFCSIESERLISGLDTSDRRNFTFEHIAARFFCRLAKKRRKRALFRRGSITSATVSPCISLYLIKNDWNKLNSVRYRMTPSPDVDRYHGPLRSPCPGSQTSRRIATVCTRVAVPNSLSSFTFEDLVDGVT